MGSLSLLRGLIFPLLCIAVFGDQKNITAVPGQNVTLTCRATNNIINIVEWSRADLGKRCVFMHRDGHFVPDYQHPSFKNRVELQDRQMKDGDVSLTLEDVTINDTGTYECRIVQKRTNRRKRANLKTDPISIINLRVVAPPGPPGGHRGLAVGLPLSALAVVAAVAIVGFLIYKNRKRQSQDSYQPPAEKQSL